MKQEPQEKMTFERHADMTMDEARATYSQRGGEYQDTWALENVVSTLTEATLARFGLKLSIGQIRLLQAAALSDIKDSRIRCGGWKRDSILDGLAYRALYAGIREEYERLEKNRNIRVVRKVKLGQREVKFFGDDA